jgi:phenylpropionate dioxygenase-like ring-hydroxylating dioxygenase large terminal subunit
MKLTVDIIESLEKAHLTREFWHLVAHRSDLANDRDFVRYRLFDDEIAVVNDSGTLLAFDNLCPHRGARIFHQEHGNAPIQCQYHGWLYRGQKSRIPCAEKFRACDLETLTPKNLSLDYCGDFIFVAFQPKQSLRDQLSDLWTEVESISTSISVALDDNGFEFQSNWKVGVENALEPDHVPFVHRDTFGPMQLGPVQNFKIGLNSKVFHEINNKRMDKLLKAIRKYFKLDFAFDGYTSYYLFPFTMISSVYGYTYAIQHFFPKNWHQMYFNSRLYCSHTREDVKRELVDPIFESARNINRKIFDEDAKICQSVAKIFPLHQDMVYSADEEKVVHFQRSYSKVLGLSL